MRSTSFNPLAVARDLKATGIEADQAEAIAEGMRQAASADHDGLATKVELAAFRSEVRWMFGFLAALVLAIAAKLFGLV